MLFRALCAFSEKILAETLFLHGTPSTVIFVSKCYSGRDKHRVVSERRRMYVPQNLGYQQALQNRGPAYC